MMSCHSTETTSSFHERLIYIEATVPLETVLGNSCVIPSRLSIVCLVAKKWANVQVDHSDCSLGLIDIKTKVAFQYMLLIIKHNFCFEVSTT